MKNPYCQKDLERLKKMLKHFPSPRISAMGVDGWRLPSDHYHQLGFWLSFVTAMGLCGQ